MVSEMSERLNRRKRRARRVTDPKFEISEDLGAFGFGKFAPLSNSEVEREEEFSDGDAEEAKGRMADSSGHFADLAVAAFAQG